MDPEQASQNMNSVTNKSQPVASIAKTERQFTCFPKLPRDLRLMIWEFALPGPRMVEIRERYLRKTTDEWESENNDRWRPGFGLPIEDDIGQRAKEHILKAGYHGSGTGMIGGLIDRLNIIIDYNVDDRRPNVLVGIGSKSVPPEILYTCRESYTVVSSRYTKSFGCLGGVAQTWFNFDRDILYIRASCFEFSASSNLFEIAAQLFSTHPMLDLENVRRVKFLAIGLGIYFNDADMMQDGYFELMLAFFMFIFRGVEKIYCIMTHRSHDIPCEEIKPEFMVDPIDIDETAGLYAVTPETNQLREVPEAILLECPPIDREIMKEWWEALMPGRGPCPSPDIEFRAILEPDTQGYLEYFKEGCRSRIQEFVKNNKVV